MSKIMKVFFTEEVEEMVGYTGQHIRRLIKENKVDLIENEDYRIGKKVSIYLKILPLKNCWFIREIRLDVKTKMSD